LDDPPNKHTVREPPSQIAIMLEQLCKQFDRNLVVLTETSCVSEESYVTRDCSLRDKTVLKIKYGYFTTRYSSREIYSSCVVTP
jgi:hypothetical protein